MFYLITHSTHFIYGYMASDIWLRTILIVRKETRCRHIDYSYRLTARVLLHAPSHRQDNTYHSLCYTSCGALAGTRNSSMCPPHEGSIRRHIAPWANTLPLSYVPLLIINSSLWQVLTTFQEVWKRSNRPRHQVTGYRYQCLVAQTTVLETHGFSCSVGLIVFLPSMGGAFHQTRHGFSCSEGLIVFLPSMGGAFHQTASAVVRAW